MSFAGLGFQILDRAPKATLRAVSNGILRAPVTALPLHVVAPNVIGNCLQCRGAIVKGGKDRNGAQRLGCGKCKWRALASPDGRYRDFLRARKAQAVELFEQGKSIRQVCAALGIVNQTAVTYRKSARAALCGCGKDSRHQGWCRHRFQRSEARQAWMAQWKAKQSQGIAA